MLEDPELREVHEAHPDTGELVLITREDPGARVGAVLGVMSAAMLEVLERPEADAAILIDEALSKLEADLPV